MFTPLISFRSGDIQGIIDAYVKRVEIGQGIGIGVSNDKRELEILRRERDTRYTPTLSIWYVICLPDSSATENLPKMLAPRLTGL